MRNWVEIQTQVGSANLRDHYCRHCVILNNVFWRIWASNFAVRARLQKTQRQQCRLFRYFPWVPQGRCKSRMGIQGSSQALVIITTVRSHLGLLLAIISLTSMSTLMTFIWKTHLYKCPELRQVRKEEMWGDKNSSKDWGAEPRAHLQRHTFQFGSISCWSLNYRTLE